MRRRRGDGREGGTGTPVTGLRRWPWLLLAWASLLLAVLGAVLPLLPTTPFVLVAAWAAARASPRLHARLLAHPLFGPMIRDWERERAVSRRAKQVALATMAVAAVLLLWLVPRVAALMGIAMMTLVGTWLWRRPEPLRPRDG